MLNPNTFIISDLVSYKKDETAKSKSNNEKFNQWFLTQSLDYLSHAPTIQYHARGSTSTQLERSL